MRDKWLQEKEGSFFAIFQKEQKRTVRRVAKEGARSSLGLADVGQLVDATSSPTGLIMGKISSVEDPWDRWTERAGWERGA